MQINISAEELRTIREWAEPILLPVLVLAWRKAIKTLRLGLNGIITDNVNRARDETVAYMRSQFQLHLDCDKAQFDALRDVLNLPPHEPKKLT